MTNQHPIIPSTELLVQWCMDPKLDGWRLIATQSAQWGADQELEACVNWLDREGWSGESQQLRAARRPKLWSLKEQALAVLDDCSDRLEGAHENTIRRALEALDD